MNWLVQLKKQPSITNKEQSTKSPTCYVEENSETFNISKTNKDNYSLQKKSKKTAGQNTSKRSSTEIPHYTP